MKRFAFPLEKVLEYRRQVELERRRALALSLKVLRSREDDLAAAAAEAASCRETLAAMGTGRISARDLALYRSYLNHMELHMARAAQWAREAREAVTGRRAELVTASKETKILEKLKSRDRARYDYAANREESKELDEIGTTGFWAGRTGGGEEGE